VGAKTLEVGMALRPVADREKEVVEHGLVMVMVMVMVMCLVK
jgi:hypothetical protein